MDWAAAARFLGALIDLIFLEKQLDLLEMAKDAAYDLADRQVALAELIIALHCILLAKTQDYYDIANNAPIYSPQHECAMDLANVDAIREANRAMNQSLDTTDMYSSGLRRDYIESAMAGIVFSSSGQWALAYRNEDELNMITDLRKYKHMVDSISAGSLFTGHATMAKLTQNQVDLATSTSRLIETHLTGVVAGVTDLVLGGNRDTGSNPALGIQNPQGFFEDAGNLRNAIPRSGVPDTPDQLTQSLRSIPGSTTPDSTFIFNDDTAGQ